MSEIKLSATAESVSGARARSMVGEVMIAIKNALPDDAVCIAGSPYLVGEAKEALDKMKY